MTRRLVPVCTLAAALALTGCGAGSTDGGGERLSAVSADAPAAPTVAQELRPLHAEAVELADLVLAAAPDADVAAVVTRIRDTQRDLLAQTDALLADAGLAPAQTGALTASELDGVRAATGDEAVRLGLDGLLGNHLAAVNKAKKEAVDGLEGAAGELTQRVLDAEGLALQELAGLR
jgi:uncharacterized protein (DUF305 family)